MIASAASSTLGRLARVGVLALTVLVFAVVVSTVTLRLRASLREQILGQRAETLGAAASMQLDSAADDLPEGVSLGEVPILLFNAVLKTSKLPHVVSVRVFDAQRRFIDAYPPALSQTPPSDDEWIRLRASIPTVRVHPSLSAEDVTGLGSEQRGLVEAWVPLRRGGVTAPIGAAQFWVQESSIANELAEHDRRLWTQAAIAWLAGSIVIVAAIGWAFRRLDAVNRELHARSEDLQRANRELVLAAKTSALGAITAHLMHELKNPIAGLEIFVAGQGEARAGEQPGGELEAASVLTRQLRTMVNDVVGVLRDEQSGAKFELTCDEIAEIALGKVRGVARDRGVSLTADAASNISLSARRANLAGLVLRNLLQNAIEATPVGGQVRLTAKGGADGAVEFLVEDGGNGLPTSVRARLFQPCASSKVGGSGLGLALSHQLALQVAGRLELVRSDENGTCFRLVLAAEA